MRRNIITLLGIILTFSLFAQEVPQKISYQGKLMQNDEPVNGTKDISFTIGSWSETHSSVEVNNGLYSVTLGSQTPIPTSTFDNSTSVQLEISVEGSNLSPNTDMLSVPYAYKSQKAVEAENTFSGSYNDLTNKPNFSNVATSGDYNDLTNTPSIFSGSYNDLTNKPNLATVATSGDYNDLSNTPSTSGLSFPVDYTGDDAQLDITNTSSKETAHFRIDNTSSGNAVLRLTTNGGGRALLISQDGDGEGIRVSLNNDQEGLYINQSGSGLAAEFFGDVEVHGDLSKSSGSFRIDHPQYPANKYLYHSFVESPDMKNIYDGVVELDSTGTAIVQLPDYFETLNKDYRYQLTCIGGYANVYISEEIKENKFKISGGNPGLKVSWQVTGIRNDPYAQENRLQVEQEKPENEKGYYLHYKEYGQPYEKSIESLEDDEQIK